MANEWDDYNTDVTKDIKSPLEALMSVGKNPNILVGRGVGHMATDIDGAIEAIALLWAKRDATRQSSEETIADSAKGHVADIRLFITPAVNVLRVKIVSLMADIEEHEAEIVRLKKSADYWKNEAEVAHENMNFVGGEQCPQ